MPVYIRAEYPTGEGRIAQVSFDESDSVPNGIQSGAVHLIRQSEDQFRVLFQEAKGQSGAQEATSPCDQRVMLVGTIHTSTMGTGSKFLQEKIK